MSEKKCQYGGIEHDCDGGAAHRVWSDVRQAWSVACAGVGARRWQRVTVVEAIA